MGDYGIKISEDGYDVKTCDEINLILNSKFSLLNVVTGKTGTVSLLSGTVVIDHNLGYIPQYIAFGFSGSAGDITIPSNNTAFYIYNFNVELYSYATTTQLFLSPESVGGAEEMESATYYIFYEEA